MLNIVTIIGARPQFIKAAVISRLIREKYNNRINEFLVHTGQHYDNNMSEIFFREMMIPEPDLNLNIGSGSHGKMTGQMLEKIENVLIERKPDLLIVYGDTNSTLAGALAASKLHIPVAHIEAGLRSYNMKMPEEQNRVLTDHISSYLFCPTDIAVSNLEKEGISEGVYNIGDVMYDASLFYREVSKKRGNVGICSKLNLNNFSLLTLHRAENTDSEERLSSIVDALNKCSKNKIIFPMHPRTKKYLDVYNLKFAKHIHIINPVGFFDMLDLEEKCDFIITDSGGVQKEAYFFNKPCITLRDQTEWVETVDIGANTLVGADNRAIINAISSIRNFVSKDELYGKGDSGELILGKLL